MKLSCSFEKSRSVTSWCWGEKSCAYKYVLRIAREYFKNTVRNCARISVWWLKRSLNQCLMTRNFWRHFTNTDQHINVVGRNKYNAAWQSSYWKAEFIFDAQIAPFKKKIYTNLPPHLLIKSQVAIRSPASGNRLWKSTNGLSVCLYALASQPLWNVNTLAASCSDEQPDVMSALRACLSVFTYHIAL